MSKFAAAALASLTAIAGPAFAHHETIVPPAESSSLMTGLGVLGLIGFAALLVVVRNKRMENSDK